MLPPGLRKATLAVHLTASIGWIGSVITYLVLGVTAVSAADDTTVRAAWIAMEIAGWFAVVPLAVASLLSGLVIALGTRWGLFRHYWVIISLALTSIALLVLLLHMPTVSATAELTQTASGAELESLGGDLVHPALGLLVLLTILVLNIYKPRGMTRHGRRRHAP